MKPKRQSDVSLEIVGPENVSVCGIGCTGSRSHEGYEPKLAWLEHRFREGLRQLRLRDGRGRGLAFLECVPGEYAWRPVVAKGWLFVHCLWVYPKGQAVGGLGARLIEACVEQARTMRACGVAVLVSDGPWMVGKEVFLRNGFEQIDERDRFQLVIHRIRRGAAPRFGKLDPKWKRSRGLHIVYAPQCPYLPKSVADVSAMVREEDLKVRVTVLKSAAEAQRAPSYYGVFNLLWNGRLLSDHYVSRGRFRNLLKKEMRG